MFLFTAMTSARRRASAATRIVLVLSLGCCALLEAPATANADPSLDAEQRELVRELEALKERARALEERIQRLKVRRAAQARASTPAEGDAGFDRCAVPFYLDASGVKHLRPDCQQVWSRRTCAQPFAFTADGIKQVRTECTVPTASF